VPFQIRVENPPADAVDLEATFASFGDMAMADGPAHVSPSATPQGELLLDQPIEPGHELIDPTAGATTSELGPVDGLAPRFTAG
jgi:hypothetical protein